jgi:hypothetical protein
LLFGVVLTAHSPDNGSFAYLQGSK